MEKNKEYYAFISYKREDEKWAKWLQDKLEHYRFPTNLNGRTDLPKNIRPTFRDVTDLTPGLLAEEINNALRNSEWLIVICSPRSAQSPWVCKEAQTFIDLGRADHIIPFVIEGKPFSDDISTECYPEALLNLTGSNELLAANVNEMGRDAALIKVVARMFNLRFDILWQRHERTKRHRWFFVATCILVFALASTGVGVYMTYLNTLIDRQNLQLRITIDNLNKELKTISNNALDKNEYNLIGNFVGVGKYNPFVGRTVVFHPKEPMVAFWDDTGFWLHYIGLNKEYHLEGTIRDLTYLSFTTDGDYLIAQGGNGVLAWDVHKRKMYKKINIDISDENLRDNPELLTGFNLPISDKSHNEKVNKLRYSVQNNRLIIQDNNSKIIAETELFQDTTISKEDIFPLYNDKHKEVLFQYNGNAAIFSLRYKKFILFFKGHKYLQFSENGEYIYDDDKLYARRLETDTIRSIKHVNKTFNTINKHTFCHDLTKKYHPLFKDNRKYYIHGNDIIVHSDTQKTLIEVVKEYTMGNMQGGIFDICDIGKNKILVLVHQDWHRIIDTDNNEIVGGLGEYMSYDFDNLTLYGLGRETYLCHAETYITDYFYLPNLNQFMIISSGGVIRVYDLYNNALKRIIVLPSVIIEDTIPTPLHSVNFDEKTYEIEYSFMDECIIYSCNLKPYLERE